MPEFVPGQNARFRLLPEAHLVIPAAPQGALLPPAARDAAGALAPAPGWTLFVRLSVCVVDGPGDAGFMVATVTDPARLPEIAAWADAVADRGGATVLQVGEEHLDEPAETLLGLPGLRGGFVTAVY